jgi:DNA invertase Pin-like site-specific DNA recombinase
MLDGLHDRGIKFRSLTEAIDTTTPTGRAMWQMIGVLAELERSLIMERTRAGLHAAKARGVKLGRKPKITPQQLLTPANYLNRGRRVVALLRLSALPAPRSIARYARPPKLPGEARSLRGETP